MSLVPGETEIVSLLSDVGVDWRPAVSRAWYPGAVALLDGRIRLDLVAWSRLGLVDRVRVVRAAAAWVDATRRARRGSATGARQEIRRRRFVDKLLRDLQVAADRGTIPG